MRLHAPSLPVAGFLIAVCSSPILVKESLAQGGRAVFGFGTGSGTIMCTACRNAGNVGGSTALIQVGGPATPHLQVGFSADWWWHDFSSPQPSEEDRKSTRLNSSHMSISYAVFCLKKKKKVN